MVNLGLESLLKGYSRISQFLLKTEGIYKII